MKKNNQKTDIEKMEAILEAVLFAMGESVEISKLALAIEQDTDTTRKLLRNLSDKYNAADRGIKIIELESSFQMCTKAECFEGLIRVASAPKKHVLTDAVLETLSIIAYKQPVTRIEIEQIRGVKCDYSVNKLLEYNLIAELGRLDAPGKPILFGTTEEFLRTFGIASVEDLPMISQDLLADFKSEAIMEAELDTVNI